MGTPLFLHTSGCNHYFVFMLFIYSSDMSVEPGVNSMEILLENGFTQEQINKLIEQGIVENNQKSKLW